MASFRFIVIGLLGLSPTSVNLVEDHGFTRRGLLKIIRSESHLLVGDLLEEPKVKP